MKALVTRLTLRIASIALLALAAAGVILPGGEVSARSKTYQTQQEIRCAFWSQQFVYYNDQYFNTPPGPDRDAIARSRDIAFDNMLANCQ
jgi:hypothetical protein